MMGLIEKLAQHWRDVILADWMRHFGMNQRMLHAA